MKGRERFNGDERLGLCNCGGIVGCQNWLLVSIFFKLIGGSLDWLEVLFFSGCCVKLCWISIDYSGGG